MSSIRQKIAKGTWKSTKIPKVTPAKFELRRWQRDFFKESVDKRHILLDAPMGSGKSAAVCYLSHFRMKKSDDTLTIISVPQTIVKKSFLEEYDFGSYPIWNPSKRQDSTDELISFLRDDAHVNMSKVAVITHSALIRLYDKLRASKTLSLLRNCDIWIDEGHHSKSKEQQEDDANRLGDVVRHILQYDTQKELRLGLITATFYRGDQKQILSSEQEKKFSKFTLPWIEHLENMQYLTQFQYDFILTHKYAEVIQDLFKERIGKTIIYLPQGKTREDTENTLSQIKTAIPNHLKILDLVTTKTQKTNKEKFHKISKRSDFDVVIALGMAKEGADWRWADREIILGNRHSLTELIQIIGRVFRDVPEKKHRGIEIFQVLPYVKAGRSTLNEYLKFILAAMIVGDMFSPVVLRQEKKSYKKREFPLERRVDKLWEVIQRISDRMFELGVNDWKSLRSTIIELVSDIDDQKYVFNWFKRQNEQINKPSIAGVKWDVLKECSPFDFLTWYTSGAFDVKTFHALREAIGSDIPSKTELNDTLQKYGNLTKVASWYRVDEDKIRKWCDVLDIDLASYSMGHSIGSFPLFTPITSDNRINWAGGPTRDNV